MDATVAVVTFMVGFALGCGVAWLLLNRSIIAAREQERFAGLADIRAAEARIEAKNDAIEQLKSHVATREEQIRELTGENQRLKQHHIALVTEIKKDREKFAEKLQLLDTAEDRFKTTFQVLAADALKENNKEFENLARPVRDTLKDIEKNIAVVNQSAANLGIETRKLVNALQKPEVRGQWGEMHLLRVVELTGMTERCDFHQQQSISDGECIQRPDLIVHLPGERNLAVDAKAPVRSFLDSADASDDEARQVKLQEFVSHVREHIRLLGSKAYYQNIEGTPEFVVLYLPTEAIYSAALTLDDELLEYASKYRVTLAGPTVLITLLRAVAHGWKQEALAKHAKEICDLGEELHKRISKFGEHMGRLGGSLKRSVDSYNQAVGSLETRVLPNARQFEQLGAAAADAQIGELTQIEVVPRELQAPEFALTNINDDVEAEDDFFDRPR